MVEIDNDVLCKFCNNAFETRRDYCEGSHCQRAHEGYLEEHGIIESGGKTFGALRFNDVVYRIKENKLFEHKVVMVKESKSGLELVLDTGASVVANRDNNISESGVVFVSKKDASSSYRKLISKTIEDMMQILFDFQSMDK